MALGRGRSSFGQKWWFVILVDWELEQAREALASSSKRGKGVRQDPGALLRPRSNGWERMAINGGGDRTRARTREKVSNWTCPRLRGRPLAGINCATTPWTRAHEGDEGTGLPHAPVLTRPRARADQRWTTRGCRPFFIGRWTLAHVAPTGPGSFSWLG